MKFVNICLMTPKKAAEAKDVSVRGSSIGWPLHEILLGKNIFMFYVSSFATCIFSPFKEKETNMYI